MSSPARSFSPIFVAEVTAPSIEHLDGANGKYMRLRGATLVMPKGKEIVRTVMAFGKSYSDVASLLKPDCREQLAIQFDGPIVRIVGLPRDKTTTSAAMSVADVTNAIVNALTAQGVDRGDAPGIAHAMITGDSDRIAMDDDHGFVGDAWANAGHILKPIMDAGYEASTALTVAAELLPTAVNDYLAAQVDARLAAAHR